MTCTLHEDLCPFVTISRSTLFRMRNVSDKICKGNQNTFYVQYFFPENRAFYEIMWKNVVEPDRPQMTKGHMRFASWIPTATKTYSEHVSEYLLHFQGNSVYINGLQQTLDYTACPARFTVPLARHNYTLPTEITMYAYFKVLITYCVFKRFNRGVFTK